MSFTSICEMFEEMEYLWGLYTERQTAARTAVLGPIGACCRLQHHVNTMWTTQKILSIQPFHMHPITFGCTSTTCQSVWVGYKHAIGCRPGLLIAGMLACHANGPVHMAFK